MSRIVVDAVGDRSLAHTKSAINTSSMHDRLCTHVAHLCRWRGTSSDQHARGHRHVSADFMICADLQCRRSCKLQRVAPFSAVSTDVTWSGLTPEHKRSLPPTPPLVEIFEKPLFATSPKPNYETFAITKVSLDPY